MILKEGDRAPHFRLSDQHGIIRDLKDYKGTWMLLYFYPKDDTPGCTVEACQLRDNFPAFKKLEIQVFGASTQGVVSHKKFADKYDLPFTLLADEDKKLHEAYGVWVEKSMYGKKYMGTARHSFLINPQGIIVKIYRNVKPKEHAEQVLIDLKELVK